MYVAFVQKKNNGVIYNMHNKHSSLKSHSLVIVTKKVDMNTKDRKALSMQRNLTKYLVALFRERRASVFCHPKRGHV